VSKDCGHVQRDTDPTTAADWNGVSYLDAPPEGFGPETCKCWFDFLLSFLTMDLLYREIGFMGEQGEHGHDARLGRSKDTLSGRCDMLYHAVLVC
jgi:hypothetical protein